LPGRLAIYDDSSFKEDLKELFINFDEDVQTSIKKYNIPPTTNIPIFTNKFHYIKAQYGLIPYFSKDNKTININARSESVDIKKSFENSFRYKRCLIPLNGWYEWKDLGEYKKPYFIHSSLNNTLVGAGIYDEWYDNKQNKIIISVALLTCEPNDLIKKIHHRMPVLLDKQNYKDWLNLNSSNEKLKLLCKMYDNEKLKYHEVSNEVNKVSNDSINCIKEYYKKVYVQTSLF